jgi:hypothetical protein
MLDYLPIPQAILDNGGMLDWFKRFSGWSGKYAHDGGREAIFFRGIASGIPVKEPRPFHNIEETIYTETEETPQRRTPLPLVKATLHVDIDNAAHLNVVSVTLPQISQDPLSRPKPWHLIGRVVSNKGTLSVRKLIVDDLHFIGVTPDMIRPAKMHVKLFRTSRFNPEAEVSFYDRCDKKYGPIKFKRISPYFREVEVEIDREEGATDPEPYNTHSHPHRPADLKKEYLTIESVFAKSGIRIIRSECSGTIDAFKLSKGDSWTKAELYDAMEINWSAFANTPQWKMWIFLSRLPYENPDYAGVMFDAYIDEPGSVNRRGIAIFTNHRFHDPNGAYCQANLPADKAAHRELFFNFIHESGHAFNLGHPHHMNKTWEPGEGLWTAPSWMPHVTSPTKPKDYTWMNYPNRVTGSDDTSSFYNQFRFQFNDAENLFLRHAPASYVQMGNESWYHNHARVSQGSLDRRLELTVRNLKP